MLTIFRGPDRELHQQGHSELRDWMPGQQELMRMYMLGLFSHSFNLGARIIPAGEE